jgi:hypothetical protein
VCVELRLDDVCVCVCVCVDMLSSVWAVCVCVCGHAELCLDGVCGRVELRPSTDVFDV